MLKIEDQLASNVAKTLLIPLWCCATPCRLNPDADYDPLAGRIVGSLDYDFSGIRASFADYGQICCLARELWIDRTVQSFVRTHPRGRVVNLGCGLSTATFRTPAPEVFWYDLDLPEVIEVRQQIFPEDGRHICIAKSFLDISWMDEIAGDQDRGILFVAGGVFHYFAATELQPIISLMARRFPGGCLFFDAVSATGMRIANRYVRKSGNGSKMLFSVNQAEKLHEWTEDILSVREIPFFQNIPTRGLSLAAQYRIVMAKLLRMLKYLELTFAPQAGNDAAG